MQFSEIIGLNEVKHTLINSVKNNHVAHAQLFLAREGNANLPLALAYATYVNCESPLESDSCGTCPSCYKFNKLIHPDLHFIFPTATTKSITKREDAVSSAFMKEWRNFISTNPYGDLKTWSNFLGAEGKQCIIPVHEGRNIIKTLVLKAFEGNYKTLVIWLPELMNINAANSILKILEEPPEKTLFLLVSNSIDKMLATILSRTQMVAVRPFTDAEMKEILIKKFEVDPAQAARVALLAEGDLNEAVRLSSEVKDDSQEFFRDWMRSCFRADYTALVDWAEKFNGLGKESQKSLLQYALTMLRESFAFKFGGENLVRLEQDALDFVRNFSKVVNERNISIFAQQFNDAYMHIERNANARILFLDLSLQVARIIRQ